jgi:hypothetical protein
MVAFLFGAKALNSAAYLKRHLQCKGQSAARIPQ